MKTSPEIHPGSNAGLGYARHGEGPIPVLVLHDWLGDHGNYDAVMPWLDGEAFTYVFADLRGYGLSIELTGACTVEEIAADCLALADRLGRQRFHVVGHSMTGMITQRLAADAPSRVISAIAVCPISAAGNRLAPEALAFFASTADDDEALRRLFQFVCGGPTPGRGRRCGTTARPWRLPAGASISTCWSRRISSTPCADSIRHSWSWSATRIRESTRKRCKAPSWPGIPTRRCTSSRIAAITRCRSARPPSPPSSKTS